MAGLALVGCGSAAPSPDAPSDVDTSVAEPALLVATGGQTKAPGADAPPIATDPGDNSDPSRKEIAADRVAGPREYGMLSEVVLTRKVWELMRAPSVVASPQDYKRWRLKRQIRVGQSHLSDAGFFPDERRAFVVGGGEGRIRVYDVASGQLLSKAPVPGFKAWGRANFGLWPSDESTLGALVIQAGEGATQLLDPTSGQTVRQLTEDPAWDLRWTAQREFLGAVQSAIPAQTSTLSFYSPDATLAMQLSSRERIDDWALSADGKLLAVTYYPSNSVEVIDLPGGKVLYTAGVPQYTNSLDFSPDGSYLAAAGAETVVMRARDGGDRKYFRKQGNNAHRVRFSPSGDALAVSAYDGHARILKVGSSDELSLERDLRHAGTANVYAVEFTRDGSALLTSSGDQTLRIWGK